MKKEKILVMIIFVSSLIMLIISVGLCINLACYVDEAGTGPATVLGGYFWLQMYWLRLVLISITTVLSGMCLLSKEK